LPLQHHQRPSDFLRLQLLKISKLEIEARNGRSEGQCGRPKTGEERAKEYCIKVEVELDEEAVKVERRALVRFILASNDLNLSAEDIIKNYK
jgi:hypothetical protein